MWVLPSSFDGKELSISFVIYMKSVIWSKALVVSVQPRIPALLRRVL